MSFLHFLKCQLGTSAIEYALIAGLLSMAIVSSVTDVGDENGKMYDDVAAQIALAKQ